MSNQKRKDSLTNSYGTVLQGRPGLTGQSEPVVDRAVGSHYYTITPVTCVH